MFGYMIRSIHDPAVAALFKALRTPGKKTVAVDGNSTEIPYPFPSPGDWRDIWMYQLLIDRFNNPAAPPKGQWDGNNPAIFQGGTFEGIRQKLGYLSGMGVRGLWLSPVQKNCQYFPTYHGYGIQDFLAIDPRWASDPEAARKDPSIVDRELQALIDEAHARGMYVIFDIVLHHTGDIFGEVLDTGAVVSRAPYQGKAYPVQWRDETGEPRPEWTDGANVPLDMPDAGIWPQELRSNTHFYRRGEMLGIDADFQPLKALVSDGPIDTQDILIRCHEYLIGKFDIDGLRIDAFKWIDRKFGRKFCTAMREFAAGIGKTNFFVFCEVWDDEEVIARYVGRNTVTDHDDAQAADAALDFPLMMVLPLVAKGFRPPSDLAHLYEHRKAVQRHVLSSHGEAGKSFVTFLDNHDQYWRVYHSPDDAPNAYDGQLEIALGSLFYLQGIPCIYYGTEQGLHGYGHDDEAVRQALWGAPNPFDTQHPFYIFLQRISKLRAEQPALRYGRQYFRPMSVDAEHFYIGTYPGDVYAFSRVLSEQEVIVAANPSLEKSWNGVIVVDMILNAEGDRFDILLTNKTPHPEDVPVLSYKDGRSRHIPVTLRPGEFIVLSNRK